MNARNYSKVLFGMTGMGLALCGALAFSVSCAGGSGGSGGSSGNSGSGGSAGDNGGSGGSGSGGSGGGSSDCPAAPSDNEVNFCSGRAQGAMTGYAYIALGASDTDRKSVV